MGFHQRPADDLNEDNDDDDDDNKDEDNNTDDTSNNETLTQPSKTDHVVAARGTGMGTSWACSRCCRTVGSDEDEETPLISSATRAVKVVPTATAEVVRVVPAATQAFGLVVTAATATAATQEAMVVPAATQSVGLVVTAATQEAMVVPAATQAVGLMTAAMQELKDIPAQAVRVDPEATQAVSLKVVQDQELYQRMQTDYVGNEPTMTTQYQKTTNCEETQRFPEKRRPVHCSQETLFSNVRKEFFSLPVCAKSASREEMASWRKIDVSSDVATQTDDDMMTPIRTFPTHIVKHVPTATVKSSEGLDTATPERTALLNTAATQEEAGSFDTREATAELTRTSSTIQKPTQYRFQADDALYTTNQEEADCNPKPNTARGSAKIDRRASKSSNGKRFEPETSINNSITRDNGQSEVCSPATMSTQGLCAVGRVTNTAREDDTASNTGSDIPVRQAAVDNLPNSASASVDAPAKLKACVTSHVNNSKPVNGKSSATAHPTFRRSTPSPAQEDDIGQVFSNIDCCTNMNKSKARQPTTKHITKLKNVCKTLSTAEKEARKRRDIRKGHAVGVLSGCQGSADQTSSSVPPRKGCKVYNQGVEDSNDTSDGCGEPPVQSSPPVPRSGHGEYSQGAVNIDGRVVPWCQSAIAKQYSRVPVFQNSVPTKDNNPVNSSCSPQPTVVRTHNSRNHGSQNDAADGLSTGRAAAIGPTGARKVGHHRIKDPNLRRISGSGQTTSKTPFHPVRREGITDRTATLARTRRDFDFSEDYECCFQPDLAPGSTGDCTRSCVGASREDCDPLDSALSRKRYMHETTPLFPPADYDACPRTGRRHSNRHSTNNDVSKHKGIHGLLHDSDDIDPEDTLGHSDRCSDNQASRVDLHGNNSSGGSASTTSSSSWLPTWVQLLTSLVHFLVVDSATQLTRAAVLLNCRFFALCVGIPFLVAFVITKHVASSVARALLSFTGAVPGLASLLDDVFGFLLSLLSVVARRLPPPVRAAGRGQLSSTLTRRLRYEWTSTVRTTLDLPDLASGCLGDVSADTLRCLDSVIGRFAGFAEMLGKGLILRIAFCWVLAPLRACCVLAKVVMIPAVSLGFEVVCGGLVVVPLRLLGVVVSALSTEIVTLVERVKRILLIVMVPENVRCE